MSAAPRPTFGDLSDLFTQASLLGYLLVIGLLVGTLPLWALLGLFAWNAFPLSTIGTLWLSLGTFSLQGGLWHEIKQLERKLSDLPLPEGAHTRKVAAQLSQLDSRYWLILEIIRLLPSHKNAAGSTSGIQRLTQVLQQQRYRFQAEAMALRQRYYPFVHRVLGDRDRDARAYILTQQQPLATPSPALPAASVVPPAPTVEIDPNLQSMRKPPGQFIGDVSSKGKKYHFSPDCQIWKGLMYDFIMGDNPSLRCDRTADIFEENGLKPCSACNRKRNSQP